MKRNKKYITVKPDQTKNYFCAGDALLDCGFEEMFGSIITTKNFKTETRDGTYWEKDGKKYAFASMDHYNTTIYKISLAELIVGGD